MTDNAQSIQPTQETNNLDMLTREEREFVRKANNAGLAVSFTPNGSAEKLTFLPSHAQVQNAELSRSASFNPEQGLPYAVLLKEKASQAGIAVVSAEEAEQVPYMPQIRQAFFETLPTETKAFVLRANLSGLNVTAKGSNGKSFLYLAPKNDQARAVMRQQLAGLENRNNHSLETRTPVSIDANTAPMPLSRTNQHQ